MNKEQRLVEVECQNPSCNNRVTVIANQPYFGILCEKCQNSDAKISLKYKE